MIQKGSWRLIDQNCCVYKKRKNSMELAWKNGDVARAGHLGICKAQSIVDNWAAQNPSGRAKQ